MASARLRYDPMTGALLEVTWKPIQENFLEISDDLAIGFMEGSSRFSDYLIIKDGLGEVSLQKKENLIIPQIFWNLIDIRDHLDLITIERDLIHLIVDGSNLMISRIFATLPGNPSWLVKTWDLHELSVIDGKITIRWPGIGNHGLYTSKINEA